MFLRLLAFLCVVVLQQASLAQTSGTRESDDAPSTCPVTKPSDKRLVPPYPYPATPIRAVLGLERIGFG